MSESVDVLVIGAGIHGAGVAQTAAAAGHSVLVLEQFQEPARGTSSRSSKLIHGGLRYLETFQLKLVRECLRERKVLIKNAPDLVHWQKFYIPVYEQSRHSVWTVFLGLCLYFVLAGMGKYARFRSVPKREWQNLDGLNQQGLRHVFQYWDAQTDDAALTQAVLRSAENMGAQLLFDAHFLRAERQGEHYRVQYHYQGKACTCQARTVVNAAGPWVTQVDDKIASMQGTPEVDLVQGTHILLPDMGLRGIYYLEAPQDGRAVFVMPWKQQTLVGTTENLYTQDPANVQPLSSEVDYLLGVVKHYFPDAQLQGVTDSFAGLRVLPRSKGIFAARSRETLLLTDQEINARLVSIYGGKLTSYRATAEKVLAVLAAQLPAATIKARTAQIPLV